MKKYASGYSILGYCAYTPEELQIYQYAHLPEIKNTLRPCLVYESRVANVRTVSKFSVHCKLYSFYPRCLVPHTPPMQKENPVRDNNIPFHKRSGSLTITHLSPNREAVHC